MRRTARTVTPVDVTAVIGSQLTYCVEVAAELLADIEEQTVRSVHQAQRPGRESPTLRAIWVYGLYAISCKARGFLAATLGEKPWKSGRV